MAKTIKCEKCGKEVSSQGFKMHDKYCNVVKEEKKKEQGLKDWISDKPEFKHLF